MCPKYFSFCLRTSLIKSRFGSTCTRTDMLVLCSRLADAEIFLYAVISNAANRLLSAAFSVHDSQPYIATGQTTASRSRFFISRLSDLLFQKHSRDFIVDLVMPNRNLISVLHSPDLHRPTVAPTYRKESTVPSMCHI